MRAAFRATFLFLCLNLAALPALAAEDAALQLDVIREEQVQLRAAVEAGRKPYSEMPAATRSQLLERQARLLGTLEGKESAADLNPQQTTDVLNTLEWIEAAVSRADDERLVCERVPILGSNRKERVCKTVGQRRAEQQAAREQLDRRSINN